AVLNFGGHPRLNVFVHHLRFSGDPLLAHVAYVDEDVQGGVRSFRDGNERESGAAAQFLEPIIVSSQYGIVGTETENVYEPRCGQIKIQKEALIAREVRN